MCAVLAPTVNSYKRIGQGFDAPVFIGWGHTNPLAVVPRARSGSPATGHGETRSPGDRGRPAPGAALPDPSCNPYLALAVALAPG